MTYNILTIFPRIFESYFNESIIGKAQQSGKIKFNIIDVRNFSTNKHSKVDDEPYGGGQGMLMMIQPLVDALKSIDKPGKIILLTPQGKTLKQDRVKSLVKEENITFICGRYEGMDYRIMDYIDEEWSIGDFVLTGGELGAMVMVDAITRLIPGVIKQVSHEGDSFENNLLEYPQYTRPFEYDGKEVPSVLLSGDHKKVREWRESKSLELTKEKRPDLLEKK